MTAVVAHKRGKILRLGQQFLPLIVGHKAELQRVGRLYDAGGEVFGLAMDTMLVHDTTSVSVGDT